MKPVLAKLLPLATRTGVRDAWIIDLTEGKAEWRKSWSIRLIDAPASIRHSNETFSTGAEMVFDSDKGPFQRHVCDQNNFEISISIGYYS